MFWGRVLGTRTTPSHRTHVPYPYATYSTLDPVPMLSTHVPTHVLDTYLCRYLHPAPVPTRTPSARTHVPYPLIKACTHIPYPGTHGTHRPYQRSTTATSLRTVPVPVHKSHHPVPIRRLRIEIYGFMPLENAEIR